MALGPGKYDDACTEVRKKHKAKSVLLIVIDGDQGSGFSCQIEPHMILRIPEILEQVAADIRGDRHKLLNRK